MKEAGNQRLKQIMKEMIEAALRAADPQTAVQEALRSFKKPRGELILIAIGKAAASMAKAVPFPVDRGLVITKDGHGLDLPKPIEVREAGHPVPDERSYRATEEALEMTTNLTADDCVLFLVSGGGSALFESPLISPEELEQVTETLLRSGANIKEMNTLRKRFSKVKGGRFAAHCAPAPVYQIVLSDVLGDPLDMIASGPAYPDSTTEEDAFALVEKYKLKLSKQAKATLQIPLPQNLPNVKSQITGSVSQLCDAASIVARDHGFKAQIVSTMVDDEARDFGKRLGMKARDLRPSLQEPSAFIYGGETVVHVRGQGKGGRNQEIALSASIPLDGVPQALLFSLASDGTDGPTDAAGAWCDGATYQKFEGSAEMALEDNNAYVAFQEIDQLIMTGPTGTNVNDLTVLLMDA